MIANFTPTESSIAGLEGAASHAFNSASETPDAFLNDCTLGAPGNAIGMIIFDFNDAICDSLRYS